MTGRERILARLQGKPVDCIPFQTLVDDITRSVMSPAYRELPVLDFYRAMDIDLVSFGGYGFPPELREIRPYTIDCGYETETSRDNDVTLSIRKIGRKQLTMRMQNAHPIQYPVETAEDLDILIELWESTAVRPPDEARLRESLNQYETIDAAIGDLGIYVPIVDQSAVQHLIEYECGLENFYYLLADDPEKMERAIAAIQAVRRAEYEYLAQYAPYDVIIPVENTSSLLTSPAIYRQYSLEHIREFSDIMHARGKQSVIHMCGSLLALLPELKETKLDGIHALTPPPIGTCPYDAAFDVLGDDLIVITGIGGAVHGMSITPEDIRALVQKHLTPRVLNARFITGIGCDGLATPEWKIRAAVEATREFGRMDG